MKLVVCKKKENIFWFINVKNTILTLDILYIMKFREKMIVKSLCHSFSSLKKNRSPIEIILKF